MQYVSGVVGIEDKYVGRVVYKERALNILDTETGKLFTGHPMRFMRDKLVGYSDELDGCVVHTSQQAQIYKYVKSVSTIRLKGDDSSEKEFKSLLKFRQSRIEITGHMNSVVRWYDVITGENEYMTLFEFISTCCKLLEEYPFGPDGFYVSANRGTIRMSEWFSDYYKFRFKQDADSQGYLTKLYMLNHRG